MKVFLAGATGALGKSLVRQLIARGHEVTGTTTSDAKASLLTNLGATPLVLDLHGSGAALLNRNADLHASSRHAALDQGADSCL